MKKVDELTGELRNIWNRKLYLWWRNYNEGYLVGALKLPLIRVGDGKHQLGYWDGARRTLSISEAHIIQDPWLSVMDTLRHEMAHQYVEEILEVVDESPHGPAFQQACKRLRCIPRARIRRDELRSTQGRVTKDEKILRRLQKILSLSTSPNEHEAQLAVQKARYLMLKYSIDLKELDEERQFDKCSLGKVKGRRMSYELWLGSILNEFFFVEVLWVQSYDALRDRKGSVLQIFGTSANLDIAEYTYHYLKQVLDRLWDKYKAAIGIRSNRERQRYFAGVLEGFYQKLDEQESTLQESYALVWKGDPKLQAFYRYLNPSVRTRYWGGVCQTQVYRDGLREGRRVTIQQPIAEATTNFGAYLTE